MAQARSEFIVSSAERAELESLVRASKTRQSIALRARIVLRLADGVTAGEAAKEFGVSRNTAYKWRRRFIEARILGLKDAPRPGQPTKITAEKAKEILFLTVHRVPREATQWSLRLMAKYADVTVWQVQQVWKAANLRPHRLSTFKISNDPDFVEKVVDIVGLYMRPPENAVVLSVDEKTQIQALDRTQPLLQLRPGQIERRTHDYKRHGTTNLYAAFDIATGEVRGRVTNRHRAKEFLAFLRQIDRAIESPMDLHLILDNSSTHKTKAVRDWLEKHPRFHLHFTPTSASWLNAVEGWFSQLERRAIHRGVFTSVADLKKAIRGFIEAHNAYSAKPFQWTRAADKIIAAVNRAKESQGDAAN